MPCNRTLARIESSTRPVAALLHDATLDGVLELALACHDRGSLSGARVGLPGINLSILLSSLGTPCLSRRSIAQLALNKIQSGRLQGAEASRC